MPRRCTRRSLPKYLVMTSYHWNVRENTVTWHHWMNDKMKITWRHARNVVSLRILYKFYFNPCYLFKIHFDWYSVFVVVKSTSSVFIIIWLYNSFTDGHLCITNKELRYHYSVLWTVERYQRGNQNLYIEAEHTIQWPHNTDKRTNNNLQNITHKTKDRVIPIPLKTYVVEVDRNVYHYKQNNGILALYSWYINVHR
jgi:hypothetical protein